LKPRPFETNMSQLDELNCLDELVASLSGHERGGPRGLTLEHLRAARTALMGAMHGEYCLSLEHAMESVSCIPEKSARITTRHTLQRLIDSDLLKSVLPAAR
jgi:hypothetical protein